MQYNIYIDTAAALAKEAGAIIRDKFGGDFARGYKSCPSDLETELDYRYSPLITER